MASRAYSQPSIDAHHRALRQFTVWADSRGRHNPAAWETFLANYERRYRPTHGPLRPNVFTAICNFLRCGGLASGFLRFHFPDCGHERVLAFTC